MCGPMPNRSPRRATLVLTCAAVLAPARALAGPPYTTDDPEPVELRHWELYLATGDQWSHDDGWSGTSPHVEVNYGAAPDLQLHVIAPVAWARPPGGPARFGYGDTELGAKYRFVHETESVPQIGTFPLVEVPTGDGARGLGAGQTQVFLPLWVQKSFGPWTTYGGAGYWVNPGEGNRSWWFFGWQAQREVVKGLSIGGEAFYGTSREVGKPGEARFDLGLVWNVSELHHVLFSIGHAIGAQAAQGYLAYQLTFGPERPTGEPHPER